MTDTTIEPEFDPRNPGDYTDSVCWLLPKGCYTLVDVRDIPLMLAHNWRMAMVSNNLTARVVRTSDTKSGHIYLHREIMGFPDGLTVDHANRDSTDNRRQNLRRCTQRENALRGADKTS